MVDSDIHSKAFQLAELRSERARIAALLTVFGSLLALVLIRGMMALLQGRHGEAWPYALLLAAMTVYEIRWRQFVVEAVESGRKISRASWTSNIVVESLLPTAAVFLQSYTPFFGPHRALTSPVVLAYFLFIILSTLHLDTALSRLAGAVSAAGYTAVSLYMLLVFPAAAGGERLMAYEISFSYAGLLLVGGYAAGAVAQQIRQHVIAALHEAESQAKIAQLEHDLGIARSIQQGLLPKSPPQVAGFDIAGWNQPADETGGDYFDWQQLADGRIAVTVADVTGHGIGPALGMSACRAYARRGFLTDTDLRSFLGRLNDLLYDDLPAEKFVTLAAGLITPSEASVRLISAGHGPLLFYSAAEDQFRTYDPHGVPLGLLPRFPYGEPALLTFASGDILVLITDGFIEWTNAADEDFGQTRVEQVIRAHRDKPSAAIISELYRAAVQFAGSVPQADDLTALLVKRL